MPWPTCEIVCGKIRKFSGRQTPVLFGSGEEASQAGERFLVYRGFTVKMDPLSLIACLPHSSHHFDGSEEELNSCSSMEEEIWRKLPQELLERILASLPLPSLLRLCTVCKCWNSLFMSPKFLELRTDLFCSQKPCYLMSAFVVQKTVGFAFFNPVLKIWHQMLMPGSLWAEGQHNNSHHQPALVASDSGLLLLGFGEPQVPYVYDSYVVCNPVTGAVKKVPPVQSVGLRSCIGFLANSSAKTFKIITAWNVTGTMDLTTEIYDSATGNRIETANEFSPVVAPTDCHQSGVFCNGFMYVISREPMMLVGLDIEKYSWSEIVRVPDFIMRPHLIERFGCLMVVGGVDNIFSHSRSPNPQSIGIWKLNPVQREWIEVERLPKALCQELQKWINFVEFQCLGQHDILYLSSKGGRDVLAYSLSNKSWHWLPDAPMTAVHPGNPWWMPVPFEPSMSAEV
ncbi:unnamed protein product [Sphagnum jensenii]|jgi:hypothetical protein|uniref:F-box domain-containing protein n=1 Tax=Sphagnum jensenii TaxID=128206 RepID=A0ABP0WMY0_9BRYO